MEDDWGDGWRRGVTKASWLRDTFGQRSAVLVDDDLGFVTQIYMEMGAITKYSAGGYHSNAEGVDTDDFTHIKDVMIAHSSERWGARVETNVLEDAMVNWAPALNALMNAEPYKELKKYTRSTVRSMRSTRSLSSCAACEASWRTTHRA